MHLLAPLYTISLTLPQLCSTNDLSANPAVGNTLCVTSVHDADDIDIGNLRQANLAQLVDMTIKDVQFIEFRTDANLTVLNQDDTYVNNAESRRRRHVYFD